MGKRIGSLIITAVLTVMLVSGHAEYAYAAGNGTFVMEGSYLMYCLGDNVYLGNSWLVQEPYAWHFDENGYAQTGLTLIDGEWWNLTADGIATRINTESTLSQTSAAPTSAAQSTVQTNVQNSVTDTAFYQLVNSIIAGCTTPDMTPDQKLYACYNYIVNNTSYVRTYETPSGDWTKGYATEVYTTGKGNCYRFAAAFAYLAKALGYDARVITGVIGAARGGYNPHGWTEINVGGTWYICDPEMQYADKKKRDFYMKTAATYPCSGLTKYVEWPLSF
ncbi:MAG: transglutaminase domain-containing protein [Lachnospiraceae bacterium]|nr:transglutaminase domain-containing protein [Lachnospiraceae bacterium]